MEPDPEFKFPPFWHDPPLNTIPGVENNKIVRSDGEACIEDGVVEAVLGERRPGDDIIGVFREAEEVGLEDELLGFGEREGAGLGGEVLELDAAGAARLPVGVIGEDFEGVDGGGTKCGLEEGQEVLGGGGLGNVEDADGGFTGRNPH